MLQQIRDPHQQARRRAAVSDAVIEGQRQLSFTSTIPASFCGIPVGNVTHRADTQDHRMIRLWDRGRPGEPEGAVIGNGRDRTADVAHAAFASILNRLVDRSGELSEVEQIDLANNGRQHAVIDFDRDAKVHRGWPRDAGADHAVHHAIVILERERERTQAVDRRTRAAVNDTSVGGTGPLPDTGVMHRDGIRGYWCERSVPFAATLLKAGKNIIKLRVPANSWVNGVLYDYLRLELEPDSPK